MDSPIRSEPGSSLDRPGAGWLPAQTLEEHEDKLFLLLALAVGGVVGAVIVVFILVTEGLTHRIFPGTEGMAWGRLAVPVAGSLLAGFLLKRFFPHSAGSGIPQTKVALYQNDGVIPLRTAIGKFVCSSITLATGIALGREGPSVQVGCGLASSLGQRLRLSKSQIRSLVPVGSAAAVAAAFNTPVAAILFTLEEIVGDLHARVLGAVVLSAATSWIVLRLLLGDEPLFSVPTYSLVHPVEFLFYAALGLVGGFVSLAFVKLLLWLRLHFRRLPESTKALQPAIGGLTVGLMALWVPEVLGVGYATVGEALSGALAWKTMALLVGLKVVATAVCYSSGNAGGVFGPSLFIGAMMGGAVGSMLGQLAPSYAGSIGAYALVGMGAAFAGIIRAPLTSVLMIFEITRDYSIIVPLMLANMVSYFISSRFQKVPLYEALLEQQGIHLEKHRQREPVPAEAALRPVEAPPAESLLITPADEAGEVLARMARAGKPHAIDEQGRAASAEDLVQALREGPELAAQRRWETRSGQPLKILTAISVIVLLLAASVAAINLFRRAEKRELALAQSREGKALLAEGRWDEAVERLRAAVAQTRSPADREALTEALVRSGRLIEARTLAREILAADASSGIAHMVMGQALRKEGHVADATEEYFKAVYGRWDARGSMNSASARTELAELLLEGGDRDRARQQAIDAAAAPSLPGQLLLRQGVVLLGARDGTGAAGVLERAVAVIENDPEAWTQLGLARLRTGDWDRARDAFGKAASLRPDPRLDEHRKHSEDARLLDPRISGLTPGARRSRSAAMLRVVLQAAECAGDVPPELQDALRQPASTPRRVANDVELARRIWNSIPWQCREQVPGAGTWTVLLAP